MWYSSARQALLDVWASLDKMIYLLTLGSQQYCFIHCAMLLESLQWTKLNIKVFIKLFCSRMSACFTREWISHSNRVVVVRFGRGQNLLLCYCFWTKFQGGAKVFRGGKLPHGGRPPAPPPCGRKPDSTPLEQDWACKASEKSYSNCNTCDVVLHWAILHGSQGKSTEKKASEDAEIK